MRTIVKLVSVVFLVAAFVLAADFSPVDGRHYGVTTGGIFFVSAEIIDAVEGSSPKLRSALNSWEDDAMTLSGSYYIYDSGRKMATAFKITWCVNIGGNNFLPHALEFAEDASKYIVNDSDIADNGLGGYNFRTKPIN